MDSKVDEEDKQQRPRIVEVVGPAGAGKTTLCTALSCHSNIRLGSFPDVRKITSAPFFIWYGLQIMTTLAWSLPGGLGELQRRELAWLSILRGWPNVLRGELKENKDLILLDQGPVYLLSELSLSGPGFLKLKRAQQVWRTWYQRWGDTVDAIIWLDATDDCLMKRIRNREKGHLVKDASAQTILKFLKDYRHVYDQTLEKLAADSIGLKVLRFDTNQQTPEEIAEQLLVEFDLKAHSSK